MAQEKNIFKLNLTLGSTLRFGSWFDNMPSHMAFIFPDFFLNAYLFYYSNTGVHTTSYISPKILLMTPVEEYCSSRFRSSLAWLLKLICLWGPGRWKRCARYGPVTRWWEVLASTRYLASRSGGDRESGDNGTQSPQASSNEAALLSSGLLLLCESSLRVTRPSNFSPEAETQCSGNV